MSRKDGAEIGSPWIGNTTTLEAIFATTTGLFPVKLSETQ
ncbi:hypothetical protein T11_4188 [Trichinella zimbabwensis]|uniref:Uncharacterized protein n=1 Tax=Trichinella zimbabwensis TaxID=268475 RepID=A0A0V1H5Z6_9BILA|nr:hypothetical protein T11_4188 [Trichinella zimbabwensis]